VAPSSSMSATAAHRSPMRWPTRSGASRMPTVRPSPPSHSRRTPRLSGRCFRSTRRPSIRCRAARRRSRRR
jgi:hypothetical protein